MVLTKSDTVEWSHWYLKSPERGKKYIKLENNFIVHHKSLDWEEYYCFPTIFLIGYLEKLFPKHEVKHVI